jgi:hypothetical protein
MAQGTLVDMQIAEGQRLLERLAAEGVPVAVAFWVKEADTGDWYLYLATPLVGEEGATRPVYSRINAVIRGMPEPLGLGPLAIKVVAPADPVAQDVLTVLRRASGRRVAAGRWDGTRLGDLSVDEAYFYPLPAGASG